MFELMLALSGLALPPLLGLALPAGGEAGPGQGDGGAPGRGLGVLKLFLLRPRPIDILVESDLLKPSRGVGGPLSRGEGVRDMVSRP